jgi:hypothetical protein
VGIPLLATHARGQAALAPELHPDAARAGRVERLGGEGEREKPGIIREFVIIQAHEPVNRNPERKRQPLQHISTRVRSIAMLQTRNDVLAHLGLRSQIALAHTKLLSPLPYTFAQSHRYVPLYRYVILLTEKIVRKPS